MSISQPEPQSIAERDINRRRAEREFQVELDKIESVHATSRLLRQEFEESEIGNIHRLTKQALREMTSSAGTKAA